MGNAHTKPYPKARNKKQVHWKAAVRPFPPGKPALLATADGTPDLITLRWTPPISDGGSPISGYLVEHRRVGSPHWVRATPLPSPYPEITLSGLEPGWRYQFRVSAENAVGYSDHSEISEPITVTLQRSAITAPQFTQEVIETVSLENNKSEFVVHFMGQPAPKVCWFKDGFEIFSSRRIRILTEHDRSVLTIHQTSLSDEGEIKCTATNKAGHASTKAKLTVEAPPNIRLPRNYEEGLLFEIGEVIRLKVSIVGRPTPLVFWSHNGESIQNSDRYEIEYVDKSSILKINEARRTDRGEYQIKAVNKLGEDAASFLVTVTDKPSPPGKARVVMALGRSVTLSWTTPEDDGGCKIGNYIVEYYRLGWDVWLKAATSRQLTTILGDLIEGSEYKFRVKAESPYGVSEPSDESEIVFIPDPKRGINHPPPRGRSQPREALPMQESMHPVVQRRKNKPRSQSSSRVEHPAQISTEPPQRPKRTKTKSQPQTPEPSPAVQRREPFSQINKSIFDRASLARDLAYGSPEIKIQNRKEVAEPLVAPNNIADMRRESLSKPDHHAVYKVKIEPPSAQKEPSPEPIKVKSPEPKKKLIREHSATMTGSSEFMLVLYSDENEKDQSDIFNLDENSIPPPLSLSAPELSNLEVEPFPPLKNSASSTDLLHERAMMRFYQAAEEEERELERIRSTNPDKSLDIPKIQINSKDSDDIVGLDRRHSLRRKLSAGSLNQQAKWAQKRFSLKSPNEIVEDLSPKTLKKSPVSIDIKREIILNRESSVSDDADDSEIEVKPIGRKLYSQNSFEHKPVSDEEAKRWMEEYEESLSESESDSDSEMDRFKSQVVKSRRVHIDNGLTEEEATYRPACGLSNLRRHSEEPFEILTKPKDLPDPNFVPKPILKKSESPTISPSVSPPLSPTKVTRSLSPRPDVVLQRNRSKSLAVPALPPLASTSSGDESDEPKKPRKRSFSLTSGNLWEQTKEVVKPVKKPPAPNPKLPSISTVAQITGITAASIVIPEKLLDKRKDIEAMKIVADHYDSIVKSVGQRRKSNPQINYNVTETRPHQPEAINKDQTHSKESLSQDSGYQSMSSYRRSSFTDHYDTFPVVHAPPRKASFELPSPTPKINLGEAARRSSLTDYPPPQPQPIDIKPKPTPGSSLSPEPKRIERIRRDSEVSMSPKNLSPIRRNSQTQSTCIQLANFSTPVHQERRRKTKGRRSVSRSKSPSKRGTSVSRRAIGISPTRPENWNNVSEQQRKLNKSPPPARRDLSVQRSSQTPSPTLLPVKRAPMLKEIMTQTSGYLESLDLAYINKDILKKDLEARAEVKLRSMVDWLTDLAMFAVACWFYLFSNELFAVPLLIIMVYRQIKEEIRKWIPQWIARRFRKRN